MPRKKTDTERLRADLTALLAEAEKLSDLAHEMAIVFVDKVKQIRLLVKEHLDQLPKESRPSSARQQQRHNRRGA